MRLTKSLLPTVLGSRIKVKFDGTWCLVLKNKIDAFPLKSIKAQEAPFAGFVLNFLGIHGSMGCNMEVRSDIIR